MSINLTTTAHESIFTQNSVLNSLLSQDRDLQEMLKDFPFLFSTNDNNGKNRSEALMQQGSAHTWDYPNWLTSNGRIESQGSRFSQICTTLIDSTSGSIECEKN